MATLRNKRNSLPSLTKFFVSKRASIFECQEETPREKRERSPCGMLEVSERKLEARRITKKKRDMARKKRQTDPYAEESTELEDDAGIEPKISTEQKDVTKKIEIKPCGHANKAVNLKNIKKSLVHGTPIGSCTVCQRARTPLGFLSETGNDNQNTYVPVIWMCAFCGHQGCDRKLHKHALQHYNSPRSDPHCLAINTQEWTVWCYKCDNEVMTTSCKKVDECLQYLKKLNEMAPKRGTTSLLAPTKTNLTSQYSGSDSRLHLSTFSEDNFRTKKLARNSVSMEAIPKAKGLMNLGNTCFFNSVMQTLSQTHFLTQLLASHLQKGQKVTLPGRSPAEKRDHTGFALCNGYSETEEDCIELKPLELHLADGGPLSISFSAFLKEMQSMGKYNNTIKPGQLFGVLCKKSTQFALLEQQDAHELLRCFLDGIRNEEISRIKRSILKAFALTEKTHFMSVSEKLRKLIQDYGKQARHTLIDDIFGGQLISTVICEQCRQSSQRFEPFMDLSLPINEEKGKPKKNGYYEEDGSCGSQAGRGESLSKHQAKKQKNAKKRCNQASKWSHRNPHQAKVLEERKARRLTEKRRPEDVEDHLQKLEEERRFLDAKRKLAGANTATTGSKNESDKFRKLVQQKSLQGRHGSEVEDDSSAEEEMEYDPEDDDDDSFGITKQSVAAAKKESSDSSSAAAKMAAASVGPDDTEVSEEEDETDENNANSFGEDSPRICRSKETSDADVEDNNDSDNGAGGQLKWSKRQPSIVIEETMCCQGNETLKEPAQLAPLDHRLLTSCQSYDNIYSASDTERYYTAVGGETMDELDTAAVKSAASGPSGSAVTTSGKGDSISISSGEAFGRYDDLDRGRAVAPRNNGVDQIIFQVNDMKIPCGSEDSLLDGCYYPGHQRDSVDSFQSLDEAETLEGSILKIRKQWISKTLDTLGTRYQTDRLECSIMSCLANFTTPELLTGSNKISCENCTKILAEETGEKITESVKSSASKQLLILSPPAVLTLQLKRFQHVGSNFQKVNKFVQFPLVLDLAPFVSSVSMGLSTLKERQSEVPYALYGIVQHSGRLDNGHYVAYVRSRAVDPTRLTKRFLNAKPSSEYEVENLIEEMAQKEEILRRAKEVPFRPIDTEKITEEIKTGKWYFVSDTYVSEVNIDKVMRAQAYLLFYERIL